MSKFGYSNLFGLLALLAFGFVGGGNSQANTLNSGSIDPMTLYGNDIEFTVYRKGDEVGYHRVVFQETEDRISVHATFLLEIDVLFFTAYRYFYESRSQWQNGMLQKLRASVDDDGEKFDLEASRDVDTLRVTHGSKNYETQAPIFPTNHWNAGVLSEQRVLNTLTGLINDVQIKKIGRAEVETEVGPVSATHYAYTGDLDTEVWYDDAGRWVKMRFKGSDGSTIDYLCRRCQGGEIKRASQ